MLGSILKSAERGRKVGRKEWRYFRSLAVQAEYKKVGDQQLPLSQPYWVACEKGVFLLRDRKILRVVPIRCYGIAFSKTKFYLSSYYGDYTAILSGEKQALYRKGAKFNFREIYGFETTGSNQRIHQITCGQSHLWVANTGRNTLLKFDLETDTLVAEIPIFYDIFNKPILYDHNHVNSVAEYGGVVVWVAHTTDDASLIGILHDNHVTAFRYHRTGVHDIFLTENNFLFCDTFGTRETNTGGVPVDKEGPVDPEFFQKPPGKLVRGVAGDWREMVMGNSYKGARGPRFKGKGSILVLRDRTVIAEAQMPFSQTYQVCTFDGQYLKAPVSPVNVDEVKAMFSHLLGPAHYERDVTPLPVPQQ